LRLFISFALPPMTAAEYWLSVRKSFAPMPAHGANQQPPGLSKASK